MNTSACPTLFISAPASGQDQITVIDAGVLANRVARTYFPSNPPAIAALFTP